MLSPLPAAPVSDKSDIYFLKGEEEEERVRERRRWERRAAEGGCREEGAQ